MEPITVDGRTYINVTQVVIKTLDDDSKITDTEKIDLRIKKSDYRGHHGMRIEMTFDSKNLGRDILKFCKKEIRKKHPVRKNTIVKLHSLQGVWSFTT